MNTASRLLTRIARLTVVAGAVLAFASPAFAGTINVSASPSTATGASVSVLVSYISVPDATADPPPASVTIAVKRGAGYQTLGTVTGLQPQGSLTWNVSDMAAYPDGTWDVCAYTTPTPVCQAIAPDTSAVTTAILSRGVATTVTAPTANQALPGGLTTVSVTTQPGNANLASIDAVTATIVPSVGAPFQRVLNASPVGQKTTWNDLAPLAEGTYTVSARAHNTAGVTSAPSASVTFSVDTTKPPPPVLTGGSLVLKDPALSWTPVVDSGGGPVTYIVRRDGTVIAAAPPCAPSCGVTDTGAPDGTHSYTVSARDAAGNESAPSNAVTVVVDSKNQTAPTIIAAPSPTNTKPSLSWSLPADASFTATGWQILRDTVQIALLSSASDRTFVDVNASEGEHSYSVRATNGSLGAPVKVLYDATPPMLAPLVAQAADTGLVALSWGAAIDAGSGVAGYVLRRSAGTAPVPNATAGDAICSVKPPITTCQDTSAPSGGPSTYTLFALDAAGNVASQSATVSIVDQLAPDPPAVTITTDTGTVRISWKQAPATARNGDIAGIRVLQLATGQKTPRNVSDGHVVCPTSPDASTCVITGLKNSVPVTFAIYAYDEVPNFSTPVLKTVTPKNNDHIRPGFVKNVRFGIRGPLITLNWLPPTSRDLQEMRVRWRNDRPVRSITDGFLLQRGLRRALLFKGKPGEMNYFAIYSVDVHGNPSLPVRLRIRTPGVATTKGHRPRKQGTAIAKTKTPAKPSTPAKPKKPAPPPTPVIVIGG